MSESTTKIFFKETGTTFVDAVPGTQITIVIQHFNASNSLMTVVADVEAPEIPEINKKSVSFDVEPRTTTPKQISFTIPKELKTAKITVKVQPKPGLFRIAAQPPYIQELTLRQHLPKLFEIIVNQEVSRHLSEIKTLNQPIIVTPDVEKAPDPLSIAGDITTSPTIILSVPTKEGVPIQFHCNARDLKSFETMARQGNRILDTIEDDRINLKFFLDQFTKYLKEKNAKVDQDSSVPIHIKATGPGLTYMIYVTQVSPAQDEAIAQKIAALVAAGKKESASVVITVITTGIDEKLRTLSQAHTINVVDIFNGIIVKGPWTGDEVLRKFLEDELGLNLVEYDGSQKGAYKPSQFKSALSTMTEERTERRRS